MAMIFKFKYLSVKIVIQDAEYIEKSCNINPLLIGNRNTTLGITWK